MAAEDISFDWQFRLYNWTHREEEEIKDLPYTFIIFNYETDKNNINYLDGYIVFETSKDREDLKQINPRIQWSLGKNTIKKGPTTYEGNMTIVKPQKEKSDESSHRWFFKLYNWTDREESLLRRIKCDHILWCYEQDEDGAYLNGYVYFRSRMISKLVLEKMNKRIQWTIEPINTSDIEIYHRVNVYISHGKTIRDIKPKTGNENPTEINDECWLRCYNEKYGNLQEGGKWMLFYDKNEIDEKWKIIKSYYNEGKLKGIRSMKVSTNKENSRASDDNSVIICYCGPADDEKSVMAYGKNLVDIMEYQNSGQRFCYYKSDKQTDEGTRSTGSKVNHKYSINLHAFS